MPALLKQSAARVRVMFEVPIVGMDPPPARYRFRWSHERSVASTTELAELAAHHVRAGQVVAAADRVALALEADVAVVRRAVGGAVARHRAW